MGSINYGALKAMPAERMGGLIGNLLFESAADIALHGGTIALTVASFLKINSCKSVIAKLKCAQTGNHTVKINSSQTITITAGSVFGSYTNAVAFNADDIQVNDYSKFSYVKFFNRVLSDSEIAAYTAGTMWSYDKDCVLWMNGKLKNGYDPTNNRHLDASKAGNHLTFGDGVTATTFPTKLKTIGGGYSFDGGDYMKKVLPTNLGNTFTISYFGKLLSNPLTEAVFYFYDENEKYYMFLPTATTLVYGHDNKYVIRILAATAYPKNLLRRDTHWLFVFNKSADSLSVYVNGVLADTMTGGTLDAISALDIANNIYIGVDADKSRFADQIVKKFSIHNAALNPIQIRDLHLRMSQDQEV